MNQIIENLNYHIQCIHTWEKELQDRPLTDAETANLNEHKRLYSQLKQELINPTRYRVEMTNTLSGAVTYSGWYNSMFEANRVRDDYIDSDLYPYGLFRVVQGRSE